MGMRAVIKLPAGFPSVGNLLSLVRGDGRIVSDRVPGRTERRSRRSLKGSGETETETDFGGRLYSPSQRGELRITAVLSTWPNIPKFRYILSELAKLT